MARNPISRRCARVSRHYNAALKSKCQCCSAVSNLNRAVGIRVVVCCCAEPSRWLLLHITLAGIIRYISEELCSSGLLVNRWVCAYLSYRRHGEPRRQDRSCIQLHLVIVREILLLEHGPTVLSDESIHLGCLIKRGCGEVGDRQRRRWRGRRGS